ncbi:acyltransferase family protein [Mucilaginibacter terrae]|uniref:acyltransferase family protein n=1 Tax=Mucilaginibacter terrae TaxID=1955052 RepID=UPI00363B4E25
MGLKYYKELDGVRGLAALMVVLFHIKQSGLSKDAFAQIIFKAGNIGQTGVILFFVLSGFLITRILIVSKHKNGYFKNFFVRRSLRIFPLYYLALVVFLIVYPYLVYGQPISFDKSWTFWLYLQNIGMTFKWNQEGPAHLWSLAVEEHFYLIWPFVVYWVSDKTLLKIIAIVIFFCIAFRILLLNNGYAGIFYFTLTTVDCLAIGGFVALNEKYNWLNLKQLGFIFFITVIILGFNWILFKGKGNDYIQILKLPFIAILYMCVINFLISSESYFNTIFKTRFLTYTGKVSYGLYIFHPLCIELIKKFYIQKSFLFYLVAVFMSSFLLASLSYYGYETWFLKLKKKFENFNWNKVKLLSRNRESL